MTADKLPAQKPPETAAEQPAKTATSGSSRPLWPILIVLLLVVLAVAVGGYWLWQQQQLQQRSQTDLLQNLAALEQQQSRQQQTQQSLQSWQREADRRQLQQDQQFQQLQQQLRNHARQLQALATTDREDWLLAEAEYLLRLGNQRLQMSRDVASARALLESADAIVRDIDDPRLFAVRQAIASDLAALRATAIPDREGLFLQLAALADQADRLVLPGTETLRYQVADSEAVEQEAASGWRASLARVWQKLQRYIRVSHREDSYEPVLAAEYAATLRQNMRLMLEQAQLALLSADQSLYQASLDKAQQWLRRYYTLDQADALALIEQLNRLQRQVVEVQIPDISESQLSLQHYLDLRHDVPVRPEPTDSVVPEAAAGEAETAPADAEQGESM